MDDLACVARPHPRRAHPLGTRDQDCARTQRLARHPDLVERQKGQSSPGEASARPPQTAAIPRCSSLHKSHLKSPRSRRRVRCLQRFVKDLSHQSSHTALKTQISDSGMGFRFFAKRLRYERRYRCDRFSLRSLRPTGRLVALQSNITGRRRPEERAAPGPGPRPSPPLAAAAALPQRSRLREHGRFALRSSVFRCSYGSATPLVQEGGAAHQPRLPTLPGCRCRGPFHAALTTAAMDAAGFGPIDKRPSVAPTPPSPKRCEHIGHRGNLRHIAHRIIQ